MTRRFDKGGRFWYLAAQSLYDGDQILAEHSATGSLLCKYIYLWPSHGPGVDQPICALRRVDSVVEYYHFDGLGSLWLGYVVALSDLWLSYADGDTIQTYEYTVYGEVSTIANCRLRIVDSRHGANLKSEIRNLQSRNPALGRFLQTDPAGQTMNGYAYCGNNSANQVDPSGLWAAYDIIWRDDSPQHVQVKVYEDAAKTKCPSTFYFDSYLKLLEYLQSPEFNDFCDVTVGREYGSPVNFIGGRPSLDYMRSIATALYGIPQGSDYQSNYYEEGRAAGWWFDRQCWLLNYGIAAGLRWGAEKAKGAEMLHGMGEQVIWVPPPYNIEIPVPFDLLAVAGGAVGEFVSEAAREAAQGSLDWARYSDLQYQIAAHTGGNFRPVRDSSGNVVGLDELIPVGNGGIASRRVWTRRAVPGMMYTPR